MNKTVLTIILIYLVAFILSLPFRALASETYEVDWPPSGEKGIHVLAITIDGCETRFKIKDEDFYDATSNKKALNEALQKAIQRAHSGCKN